MNNERFPIPKSIILYGPPGTGKTFSTTALALDIFSKAGIETDAGNAHKKEKLYSELEASEHIRFVTFHQSYSYEDFVEGIKAKTADGKISYNTEPGVFKSLVIDALREWLRALGVAEGDTDNKTILVRAAEVVRGGVEVPKTEIGPPLPKPYVLIIDEINRGNVAKIFGELITLIEDSKRAKPLADRVVGDQPTGVRLPLSGDTLYLPPNLYIIGTMNTADRSLIGMDMAMRRRFSFRELLPRPDLLNTTIEVGDRQLSLRNFLIELNQRIDNFDTPDHSIGHAYLMGVGDFEGLKERMRNKIIPQLRENLVGNPEALQRVLSADINNPREKSLVNELGRPIDERIDDLQYYMTSQPMNG